MKSMARRRYQRGQLIKKADRFIARWREDVIDGGQIVRVHRSKILMIDEFPTKRLAQRWLDDTLREINSSTYRPAPAHDFEQFAIRWKISVMVQHKPSTQSSERSVIDNHLIPAFRKLSLRDISAELIQGWVTKQTCSPKTVKNMVTTLRTMWSTAKAWGYTQANPFEGLKLPKSTGSAVYFFSADETLIILDAAKGLEEWKQLFLRVLAQTGMRPGELAGLRRADVQGRILHIKQSAWQGKIQTPKTKTAVRSFPVGIQLSLELDRYIQNEPERALVFASASGKPMSIDNFRQRVLNPILEQTGILAKIKASGLRCGSYAFRHGAATNMDQLGVPMKTRQAMLGHARAETTMGYTHAVDAAALETADRLEALLSPKADEAVQ